MHPPPIQPTLRAPKCISDNNSDCQRGWISQKYTSLAWWELSTRMNGRKVQSSIACCPYCPPLIDFASGTGNWPTDFQLEAEIRYWQLFIFTLAILFWSLRCLNLSITSFKIEFPDIQNLWNILFYGKKAQVIQRWLEHLWNVYCCWVWAKQA